LHHNHKKIISNEKDHGRLMGPVSDAGLKGHPIAKIITLVSRLTKKFGIETFSSIPLK